MLIPLLSAGNFVIGMGAFVVIGLITPLSEGLGITTAEAGSLLTVYAFAYALGSPLAASLTGGMARRSVLAIGMAIFGAAALLSALAPNLLLLDASRILAAIGAGLFTPISAGVAASIAAPEARGTTLAQVFFGVTLAQVIGVPAGSYLAYTYGWQVAFALVAALALPVVVGVLVLVPRDLPFKVNRLPALGMALSDRSAMLAILFTTVFLAAIYVVYTFLAPLLTESMGYGRDRITLALLAFGLGAVAGNLFGGTMADRLGPLRTLMILTLAQIALMPIFSLLPMPGWKPYLLIFVWSTFAWSFVAPQQMRLIAIAPEQQNVILSLNSAAIYVGAAIGSSVGALSVDTAGLGAVGLVGGLLGLLALVMLMGTARATQHA